jgi:hypothetical protein
VALIAQGLVFCVTILSCLSTQFFNYQGYKCEARSLYGQSSQSEANVWFVREDTAVISSVVAFLAGVAISAATFITTFATSSC